jgi:hypothetical protein
MISVCEGGKSRHFLARQPLILVHHSPRSRASAPVARHASIRPISASAGIGDDRQVDPDILVDGGAVDIDVDLGGIRREGVEPAVTRSSKRAPTQTIRSASFIAILAS